MDIEKQREIIDAMSPEPWMVKPTRIIGAPQIHDSEGELILTIWRCPGVAEANAAGIAAAREEWPAALDEVKRLEEENEELRRALEPFVPSLDTHDPKWDTPDQRRARALAERRP